ncbi:MAG: (Fe-S)-binding protein [Kouleothrix sp.]|nr:(Fe-S)-binding protein [Kouleothrix sp.]
MASIAIDQNVIATTEGCRYCLMCRHVCPVTRVTYNEATSPHGWALTIASVRRGLLEWNAETADLLYQCADCGLCQANCATDQPLPYAIVAARAEVVAAGRAPAAVAELDAALRQGLSAGAAGQAQPAEVALFCGAAPAQEQQASLGAARSLLEHVGMSHAAVAAGRESGYLAYTLGLHETARDLALATVDEIRRLGCRTLLTMSPEQAHALKHLYPLLGAPLPEQVEVVELTGLLAALLDEGRLKLRPAELDAAYHDPCQTARLEGRGQAPRRLLAALAGQPPREGFWRERRATSCGASGGLPWTQPRLAAAMAAAALADSTRDGARVVVTEAPGCLAHLRANAPDGLEVRGLYELLAEQVLSAEF